MPKSDEDPLQIQKSPGEFIRGTRNEKLAEIERRNRRSPPQQ